MNWREVERRIAGGENARTEFRELLNVFGLVLTEKQIISSAKVDDIDFGAVRSFMRAQGLETDEVPQPAREDDLRNASIADELDGVLRRHEMMANAMVVGGLMERRGRGWLTMRHTMRRFNGTAPDLVSDERNRFVRVTFRTERRDA